MIAQTITIRTTTPMTPNMTRVERLPKCSRLGVYSPSSCACGAEVAVGTSIYECEAAGTSTEGCRRS
ncbi:hypothetical protein M3J09_010346 [Ascochyta lentis]